MLNIQFNGNKSVPNRKSANHITGGLVQNKKISSYVLANTGEGHEVAWKFLGSKKNDSQALLKKAKQNGWKFTVWNRGPDGKGRMRIAKTNQDNSPRFSAYA